MRRTSRRLLIAHGGNSGNTIERSVDPALRALGIGQSVRSLKRMYPSFRESGSPDYSYHIVFKLPKKP